MRILRKKVILATVVLIASAVIMAPFCDWMFACGFAWFGTTSGQLCNVHQVAPLHCPWCSHGTLDMINPLVGFFAGGFFPGSLALRTWRNLPLALGIAPITLLPVGVLMGLITVLMTHYPHFF